MEAAEAATEATHSNSKAIHNISSNSNTVVAVEVILHLLSRLSNSNNREVGKAAAMTAHYLMAGSSSGMRTSEWMRCSSSIRRTSI